MRPLLICVKRSPAGTFSCRCASSPQQTAEPSERSPQVCTPPLLMDENRSDGGGVPWPRSNSLAPQHTALPSERSPHVWKSPLLTDSNRPSGGEDSPYSSLPQQSTAPPFNLTAQVCESLLSMAAYATGAVGVVSSAGGSGGVPVSTGSVNRSGRTCPPGGEDPLHCCAPADGYPARTDTAYMVASNGNRLELPLRGERGEVCEPRSQQTTVPSARTPHDFAQPMSREENSPDGGEVLPVFVGAPACDGAVGPDTAAMRGAARNRDEGLVLGGRCLAVVIVAPALYAAAWAQPTRMRRTGADGREGAGWRHGPRIVAAAPASDLTARQYPARVLGSRAEGGEPL